MILVTGASGFIGHHVVNRLIAENEKVVVLVRDASGYDKQGDETVVQGSLADASAWRDELKGYEIESCIHLAWEGIPDYSYEMSKKNLMYGLTVLEMCRYLNIGSLIIAGSCWEYESPRGAVSVDHKISIANDFKAAKNSLRCMAHAFCAQNNIRLHWMRLFYVYGPGQRGGSLIPHIIESFRGGVQPSLNGAYNRNDFVYVKDVADAIYRVVRSDVRDLNANCAESGSSEIHKIPEILNVGSGESTQVLDIVRIVAKHMNFALDESQYHPNGNEADFYADKDEMNSIYGWSAKTGIEEGIVSMLSEQTEY